MREIRSANWVIYEDDHFSIAQHVGTGFYSVADLEEATGFFFDPWLVNNTPWLQQCAQERGGEFCQFFAHFGAELGLFADFLVVLAFLQDVNPELGAILFPH